MNGGLLSSCGRSVQEAAEMLYVLENIGPVSLGGPPENQVDNEVPDRATLKEEGVVSEGWGGCEKQDCDDQCRCELPPFSVVLHGVILFLSLVTAPAAALRDRWCTNIPAESTKKSAIGGAIALALR